MTCALCGAQNAEDTGYCTRCGVMLGLRCPQCGGANNPKARRCGGCGTLLQIQDAIRKSVRAPIDSRRMVTVLFADVVGYTSMVDTYSDRTESIRTMLAECFDALAAIVLEQGGTIEKFIGDAVCALFGAPAVHEDDPHRALLCAVEMCRAVERLNRRRQEAPMDEGVPLRLRIGVTTGEVVGGTAQHAGERQYSVTGDAVNTASRLQAMAEPGQILVGAPTERLARQRFDFRDLGPVKLKGKRVPVQAFLLVGERQERLPATGVLVNRRRELHQLGHCLSLVTEGDTQLVELVGDAGVGKTRLVGAFMEQASGTALIARGSCPPLAATPLFPFRTIAEGLLRGLQPEDSDGTEGPESTAPLEDLSAGGSPAHLDHPIERVASAIHDAIRAISRSRPAVVVLENVHRADPETLELLRRIVTTVGDERLLLLWTRRTGEEMLLEGDFDASLTRLRVKPLTKSDSRRLMLQLLEGVDIPQTVQDLVVDRSAGNPLYIEAMVRAIAEDRELVEGAGAAQNIEIPATVQGLIQARLDSIPESQRLLLQEAAVVGREFDSQVLRRVDLFGIDVVPTLETLARRGMLEHGASGTYRFRHVLTQEVAYATMLEGLRTELHREVADALIEMFPNESVDLAPIRADHYAKAGDTDRAVEVLIEAGSTAGE